MWDIQLCKRTILNCISFAMHFSFKAKCLFLGFGCTHFYSNDFQTLKKKKKKENQSRKTFTKRVWNETWQKNNLRIIRKVKICLVYKCCILKLLLTFAFTLGSSQKKRRNKSLQILIYAVDSFEKKKFNLFFYDQIWPDNIRQTRAQYEDFECCKLKISQVAQYS